MLWEIKIRALTDPSGFSVSSASGNQECAMLPAIASRGATHDTGYGCKMCQLRFPQAYTLKFLSHVVKKELRAQGLKDLRLRKSRRVLRAREKGNHQNPKPFMPSPTDLKKTTTLRHPHISQHLQEHHLLEFVTPFLRALMVKP